MTNIFTPNDLKEFLKTLLAKQESINQELLDAVSINIRKKANSLDRNEYSSSTIEHYMNQTDLDKMKQLLIDLAEVFTNK